MTDQWRTLTESLAELERTDPEVAKAKKRLDEFVDDYLWRAHSGVPVTRFRKGCGNTPLTT